MLVRVKLIKSMTGMVGKAQDEINKAYDKHNRFMLTLGLMLFATKAL